jgi:2-polyprenyl-6-methoxyphenol hydroxylase-like FAD-dependent oxidoreductase
MALEDAYVLAKCLRAHDTVAEGFRRYESLRFPHARSAVLRSRWLGQVGQWEGRIAVSLRNTITRLLPAQLFECHSTRAERLAAMMGGVPESA